MILLYCHHRQVPMLPSDNKANHEIDELREKLRRSEEQAQQNYDEMRSTRVG